MSELNKQVNSLVRKQRIKGILKTIFGLLIFVPLAVIYLAPPQGNRTQIPGTVVSYSGVPSKYRNRSYAIIKLDNGNQVRALKSNPNVISAGDRVTVSKHESLVCCGPKYYIRKQ